MAQEPGETRHPQKTYEAKYIYDQQTASVRSGLLRGQLSSGLREIRGTIVKRLMEPIVNNALAGLFKVDFDDLNLEHFDRFFAKPGLEVEIGYIERLFFTICVAFNLSGVVIAIIAWVTLKMFYIWYPAFETLKKLKVSEREKKEEIRLFSEFAMSSVLGCMVSIIFAIIAGLFCRYGLNV